MKISLEDAKLSVHQTRKLAELRAAHAFMVTLPSLLKMRLSELVVSLWPTTRGFCVVP